MYNYREAVKADIKEWYGDRVKEAKDLDQREELYDELWLDDSITGNGSGSYTFNGKLAKQFVLDDIRTVLEAYKEFGDVEGFVRDLSGENWESMDVTARCYLLGECLEEVYDETEDA